MIGKLERGQGKKLAIRADMDALPLSELTEVPWKSRNENVMHACGHDGHMASLLGAARLLSEEKTTLNGTVYFCFQEGEEKGTGAADCVAYLQKEGGVDYAIGSHLTGVLDTGQIDLAAGTRANGAIIFFIDIQGIGGHGSRPDLSVNPVTIACETYQRLIQIPSHLHEASKTTVISPCVVQAGSKFNIIPEQARIEGTIRFSDADDGEKLMEQVRRTAEKTAEFYGGTAQVDFEIGSKYPVINTPEEVRVGREEARQLGFEVLENPPYSASDNFSEFLHAFPGFYCMVGAKSGRPGTSGINHAPNFDKMCIRDSY